MDRDRDDYALLLARCCLASLFLWSGLEKLFDMHGAAVYAAGQGMPFALTLMPLAILLEVGCGLMLVLGWRVRVAAIVLALWMLVLGPWFHQFWLAPADRWQGMIDDFFHHVVMIGGMIYVAVFGAGRLALDARGRPYGPPSGMSTTRSRR